MTDRVNKGIQIATGQMEIDLSTILDWAKENDIDLTTVTITLDTFADFQVSGKVGAKHKFILPVGDWSGDGHEKCNNYTIESNKPVKEVAVAYFKSREANDGFDIGKICGDYEDHTLHDWQIEAIQKMGVEPSEHIDNAKWMMTDDVINLWMAFLNKIDPDLKLTISEEPRFPYIYNWSFGVTDDDYLKNLEKEFNTPGYGCF